MDDVLCRMFCRSMLAAVVVLVVTMDLPSPASAADSNEAVSSDLSEVVVTARRVEERLQDVPMSITVLSQRDLTDFNISSANDLAAYIPAQSFGPPRMYGGRVRYHF